MTFRITAKLLNSRELPFFVVVESNTIIWFELACCHMFWVHVIMLLKYLFICLIFSLYVVIIALFVLITSLTAAYICNAPCLMGPFFLGVSAL